jgi:Na+/proline symporter
MMEWLTAAVLFAASMYLNVKACAWIEQRFNRSLRLSRGAKFYGFYAVALIVCIALAISLVPPSTGPYSYVAIGIAAGVAHMAALALCGHKVQAASHMP